MPMSGISLKKKLKKKLCSDPGSNRVNVEPSVGSLTLCPQCYKAIQKNPKKIALYFMGKNMSRVPYGTPDW
jgi:hypothetical protein